jgi:hypothetical protein
MGRLHDKAQHGGVQDQPHCTTTYKLRPQGAQHGGGVQDQSHRNHAATTAATATATDIRTTRIFSPWVRVTHPGRGTGLQRPDADHSAAYGTSPPDGEVGHGTLLAHTLSGPTPTASPQMWDHRPLQETLRNQRVLRGGRKPSRRQIGTPRPAEGEHCRPYHTARPLRRL